MSNRNFFKFIQYAIFAGIFGSLSSVFGKLSTETSQNILFSFISSYSFSENVKFLKLKIRFLIF